MNEDKFTILMNALYSNGQLFIPQGQDINEWINNTYDSNKLK